MRVGISVAMATYNGEQYIEEQLASLAEQALLPRELVVCDDRSTDRTLELVRQFSRTAPFPVRIHVNDSNLGYADNFLRAASLCTGEWIAFCDQDDVWLPNKIARVTEAISAADDELMLVAHTSLVGNEALEVAGLRLPDFRRDACVLRATRFSLYCISGFSLVFRARLLREIDPKLRPVSRWEGGEKLLGHDFWITILAHALGDSKYISEPLAIWRRHGRSTTPLAFVEKHVSVNRNLRDCARASFSVVESQPYIALGTFAESIAESFRKCSAAVQNDDLRARLITAANDNAALSNALFQRAKLYESRAFTRRLFEVGKMLLGKAYFGRRYCSLGWRSFAKDVMFAFGLIG